MAHAGVAAASAKALQNTPPLPPPMSIQGASPSPDPVALPGAAADSGAIEAKMADAGHTLMGRAQVGEPSRPAPLHNGTSGLHTAAEVAAQAKASAPQGVSTPVGSPSAAASGQSGAAISSHVERTGRSADATLGKPNDIPVTDLLSGAALHRDRAEGARSSSSSPARTDAAAKAISGLGPVALPMEPLPVTDVHMQVENLGAGSTSSAVTGAPATAAIAPTASLGASGVAPHIAQQVAQTLADAEARARGSVELALDPPELGRLRLSFAEVSGTLTLTIAADRPETADLMRRHLSLLAQEFARAGLDAPSVDIRSGSDGRAGSGSPGTLVVSGLEDTADGVAADPALSRSRAGPAQPADGLDLRL
jgi:flagellar hook-length control protein FliK